MYWLLCACACTFQRQMFPNALMLDHPTCPGTILFMTLQGIRSLKWQVSSAVTNTCLFLFFLLFPQRTVLFIFIFRKNWIGSAIIVQCLNNFDVEFLSVGDDNFGRKVIVFNACRMPPHHQLDHHKLLM